MSQVGAGVFYDAEAAVSLRCRVPVWAAVGNPDRGEDSLVPVCSA